MQLILQIVQLKQGRNKQLWFCKRAAPGPAFTSQIRIQSRVAVEGKKVFAVMVIEQVARSVVLWPWVREVTSVESFTLMNSCQSASSPESVAGYAAVEGHVNRMAFEIGCFNGVIDNIFSETGCGTDLPPVTACVSPGSGSEKAEAVSVGFRATSIAASTPHRCCTLQS